MMGGLFVYMYGSGRHLQIGAHSCFAPRLRPGSSLLGSARSLVSALCFSRASSRDSFITLYPFITHDRNMNHTCTCLTGGTVGHRRCSKDGLPCFIATLAMSMFAGGPTRMAQPPGGRTSFSFNDGSDVRLKHSRPLGDPGAGYFGAGVALSKPPGGGSSFTFDDSISRMNDMGEQRRHTNGLRMLPPPRQHDDSSPDLIRQPPGGRSSFSLTDASYNRNPSVRNGDALDQMLSNSQSQSSIASQRAPPPYTQQQLSYDNASAPTSQPREPPPHVHQPSAYDHGIGGSRRQSLAPPGGRTSFSLGWGGDQGNHHHAYLGRRNLDEVRDPARANPLNMEANFGSSMRTPSFASAFADKTMAMAPPARSGLADFSSVHAGGRSSTGLSGQPPGGASSFVFG